MILCSLGDAVGSPGRVRGDGGIELRWRTVPPPCSAIAPAMTLVSRNGPTRLVFSTASRSSQSVSSSGRRGRGPSVLALWMSRLTGPTKAAAAPAMA